MSAPTLAPARVFSFVEPDHPFGPALQTLREQVAARPVASVDAARSLVSAEIKGVRTADGWRLDRFSCCTQRWGHAGEPAFAASTLYWRDGHGPAAWTELPDEPYLCGLAEVMPAHGRHAADYEVLRYVPLRRFTWRADGLVHKVKRRSRLADSYARAAAVVAAAEAGDVAVPALRGTSDVPASYRQDLVPAPPLSELAVGSDLLPLLAEAGAVHASFGELEARRLPETSVDALVPELVRAADWVAHLLPELDELLRRTASALVSSVPQAERAALATCHGDLVPSHLLGGPGRWSVIDLDLAHRGDRYRDLAVFLSGMPADVAALADGAAPPALLLAAEQAYLDGYAARWGCALDLRRLAWHRAGAELQALSVMASKDRVQPAAVVRSRGVLERLLPELGAGR